MGGRSDCTDRGTVAVEDGTAIFILYEPDTSEAGVTQQTRNGGGQDDNDEVTATSEKTEAPTTCGSRGGNSGSNRVLIEVIEAEVVVIVAITGVVKAKRVVVDPAVAVFVGTRIRAGYIETVVADAIRVTKCHPWMLNS